MINITRELGHEAACDIVALFITQIQIIIPKQSAHYLFLAS